jgi:glycosyltransferase involved in cell wall biosynthesis
VSAEIEDHPLVSVVIDTVTCRYDIERDASMAEDLAPTLLGLERQTYPKDRIEAILVLGPEATDAHADAVSRRFGFVRFVRSAVTNYCATKNQGARAARGSLVALLDADCAPDARWLEHLVSRLEPGIAAVAGKTRYATATPLARTLAVPDFGYVLADDAGMASGFNINNLMLRREVLVEHPLDPRIRRNGGCYLLYHQLRAAGRRVVYEDRAVVSHGTGDIRGTRFVRQHFGRGFDGVGVYRIDERRVLRGSSLFARFGAPALVAITARRILLDWVRLARHHKQVGISALSLPYFSAVAVVLRLIELTGMVAAVVRPDLYTRGGTARAPSDA